MLILLQMQKQSMATCHWQWQAINLSIDNPEVINVAKAIIGGVCTGNFQRTCLEATINRPLESPDITKNRTDSHSQRIFMGD
jgi:hypothetical protein